MHIIHKMVNALDASVLFACSTILLVCRRVTNIFHIYLCECVHAYTIISVDMWTCGLCVVHLPRPSSLFLK